MRGPRPGAPEGPGMMCSPRLAHPGPHWRPRMEQGIKTDHPWIYLNNNKLYKNRINTLLIYYASSCLFYKAMQSNFLVSRPRPRT